MCSLSTHRLMDGLVSSKKCRTVILGLLLRFPLKCCMQDEHMERSPLTEEHHQAHQGSELSLCQHASFQHDCQRRWCGPHLHPVSQPDERCSLLLHQHRGGQHASYAPNPQSWPSHGSPGGKVPPRASLTLLGSLASTTIIGPLADFASDNLWARQHLAMIVWLKWELQQYKLLLSLLS